MMICTPMFINGSPTTGLTTSSPNYTGNKAMFLVISRYWLNGGMTIVSENHFTLDRLCINRRVIQRYSQIRQRSVNKSAFYESSPMWVALHFTAPPNRLNYQVLYLL